MNFFRKLFTNHTGEPIRVHHGYRNEVGGPFVKLERMSRFFPDHPKGFNLIYAVSGCDFPLDVARKAKRRGVPIVCHFNSCWHPAYSPDWKKKNETLTTIHNELANYVVYGSKQAMEGAKRYVGEISRDHQIIFNAVDIDFFTPPQHKFPRPLTLLAAGFHQYRHRLEPLIRGLALLQQDIPDARLIIAGKLKIGVGWEDCRRETLEKIAAESGAKNIEFIPSYKQEDAPSIYHRGDILVHLKHMDWTPNVVAEAMACGLPVVHTGNGGSPEIVKGAGASALMPTDWDHIREAKPEKVKDAIMHCVPRLDALSTLAREIAARDFSLSDWIGKHRALFENLLKLKP